MEVSVSCDKALIDSFQQISFGDIGASSQLNAEDVAKSESVEEILWFCFGCQERYYKEFERDLWTVSMKLKDESTSEDKPKKWREFKEIIKEAVYKYGFDIVKDETVSVSSEALINSFVQIDFVDTGASSQSNAKDVAKGESEEKPFYHLWTVSMKRKDEATCEECHLKEWRQFKEIIKVAADKNGFNIVKDETESLPIKDIPQEMRNLSFHLQKKSEEMNGSTKADENLEEKKGVSTEADDDGREVIYEADVRDTLF